MNEGRKVSVNEGSNGRLMRVKEEERNKAENISMITEMIGRCCQGREEVCGNKSIT